MHWCKKLILITDLLTVFISSWWGFSDGVGIDVGLCDSTVINCQCGSPGYIFPIQVKQCTYFYRWKNYCKPCNGVSEENLCPRYSHCLDCNTTDEKKCATCPRGKYGDWCSADCDCQNGGECKRDGTCICQVGYHGSQCQMIARCPLLQSPSFGNMTMDSNITTVGTSATFHCNNGFKLEGEKILYCLLTKKWSSSVPRCLRKCPIPRAPSNGFVEGVVSDLVSGSIVVFTCKPGFSLQGSAISKCLPDGTWSQECPTCEKVSYCKEPSHPENSNRQVVAGIHGDFTPGTKIHYECQEGTEMFGSKTIKCKENGEWTTMPPVCLNGKLCRDPGELENGQRIIHRKTEGYFPPNSSIEYLCNPLYSLVGEKVITCTKHGIWNSERPTCKKTTTCVLHEELPNIKVIVLPPLNPKSFINRKSSNKNFTSGIGSRGIKRRFNITSIKFDPLPPDLLPPVVNSTDSSSTTSGSRQKRGVPSLPLGHYHVGFNANYRCISTYYKLLGSPIRTCQDDGTWSGTPPICLPDCGKYEFNKVPSLTHANRSDIGQWPWQVAITVEVQVPDSNETRWFIDCGGSVINEHWTLTAAHCVGKGNSKIAKEPSEIRLYFGKHYRKSSMDDDMVQEKNVSAIYIHPDYNPKSFDADIALIQMDKPIVFTRRVQAVCLPEYEPEKSNERVKEGKVGNAMGWGLTENQRYSSSLRHIDIPVVSNSRCEEEYRNQNLTIHISENTFCAGYDEGEIDTCSGDSGGPLVFPFDEKRERWVQEGIVSWGSKEGCGKPKQFSGFTRVQRFMPWIAQFI